MHTISNDVRHFESSVSPSSDEKWLVTYRRFLSLGLYAWRRRWLSKCLKHSFKQATGQCTQLTTILTMKMPSQKQKLSTRNRQCEESYIWSKRSKAVLPSALLLETYWPQNHWKNPKTKLKSSRNEMGTERVDSDNNQNRKGFKIKPCY